MTLLPADHRKRIRRVYAELGIDTGRLGCVMMRTVGVKVSDILSPQDVYYPDSEDAPAYIGGIPCEVWPHVTLMYGLLHDPIKIKSSIEALLRGWTLPEVSISGVVLLEFDHYDCLVAEVKRVPALLDANIRLSALPHVDMFPTYSPHVTLAYLRKGLGAAGRYAEALDARLRGGFLPTTGIMYSGSL